MRQKGTRNEAGATATYQLRKRNPAQRQIPLFQDPSPALNLHSPPPLLGNHSSSPIELPKRAKGNSESFPSNTHRCGGVGCPLPPAVGLPSGPRWRAQVTILGSSGAHGPELPLSSDLLALWPVDMCELSNPTTVFSPGKRNTSFRHWQLADSRSQTLGRAATWLLGGRAAILNRPSQSGRNGGNGETADQNPCDGRRSEGQPVVQADRSFPTATPTTRCDCALPDGIPGAELVVLRP